MPGFHDLPAPIAQQELLDRQAPEWPVNLLPDIRFALAESGRTFGVLDDDPTGTQTVYDALVVTGWSESELTDALLEGRQFFYVLTNTRSLPESEAAARAAEAARNLAQAARKLGRDVVVGIRGDSTLRGHHPAETWAVRDVVEAEQGEPFDGELLVPFFHEGGRVTVDNVHYVLQGEQFVPAGQTEFALDSAFGFRSSQLQDWTEEKTGGRVKAGDVAFIGIDDLRRCGPERVCELLLGIHSRRTVVVNAASYRDLEVFVLGLLRAEAAGKRFLYRTAASFVRVRVGQEARPLLGPSELRARITGSRSGGLVVVGSHVGRTTEQLEAARAALPDLVCVELEVQRVLDEALAEAEIADVTTKVSQALAAGQDTLLYTSRRVASAPDRETSLRLSQRVSHALVQTVRRLERAPRYLIAKGGITSSDLATKALDITRAEVPGQVAPGVPCWLPGPGSRFPGIPYIVFPGNVGGADALAQVMRLFRV